MTQEHRFVQHLLSSASFKSSKKIEKLDTSSLSLKTNLSESNFMEKHIYDAYVADGWKLFALYRAKEEKKKVKGVYGTPQAWNDMSKPSDPYNPKSVYGGIPPKSIFVIDYDVKNGKVGEASKLALEKALGVRLDSCVISPSLGGHVYVKTETPFTPKKAQENYPDIDFQCHGTEWVMCGGQFVEGYGEYKFDDPVDEYFTVSIDKPFTMLTERNEIQRDGLYGGTDETDHFLTRPDIETVRGLLDKLDPNMSYEGGWHNVIMSLNSWDMGGDVGLALAIEWSQESTAYDPTEEEIEGKYRQSVPETPDFYKKLFGMVNTGDIKSFKSRILEVQMVTDLEDIANDISKSLISSADRATIGEALAKKAKDEGFDNRLRVPHWKKLCAMNLSTTKDEGEASWLENVVFVETMKPQYYFLDTKVSASNLGVHNRYSGEIESLGAQMAIKNLSIETLVKRGYLKVCYGHEYNPRRELIFNSPSGAATLNTFRQDSVPTPAEEYTERGKFLINNFEQHLKNLMSESEARVILDWMAFGVQNKGRKILWVPLIQSVEGLGKSIIGDLLINHCYGVTNAGTADPEMVTGGQSAWATDRMLRVIEELRLSGHSRFEVADKLKTFVTNSIVARSEKYERSANVPNYCNFIALTNHKDAVPVDKDSRRWWIVYSRQPSMQALEEQVGMKKAEYFAPLWELAKSGSECGAEFHKWMMERDVSGFEPSFAPDSIHKDRMIATEESKTEHLYELRSLIEIGSKGVSGEILSTKYLKQAMQSEHWDGDVPNDHTVAGLLRRLGYSRHSKKLHYEKIMHTVWYKNEGMSATQIVAAFHDVMELDDVLSDFDIIEEI